jgi:hypothetical protein
MSIRSSAASRRRIAIAAILLAFSTGCSRVSPDARAARRAVGRYLAALASHDAAAIHDLATCALSDASVLGGTVLRLGALRRIPVNALDSLATSAGAELRACEEAWTRATEESADSLWLRRRALERREALYRNALAAARRSGGMAAATVVVCRTRVRIRWGGPLVGPEPVDREHVVRVLAAPGGRWVVFSSFLPQDDPPAEPI